MARAGDGHQFLVTPTSHVGGTCLLAARVKVGPRWSVGSELEAAVLTDLAVCIRRFTERGASGEDGQNGEEEQEDCHVYKLATVGPRRNSGRTDSHHQNSAKSVTPWSTG